MTTHVVADGIAVKRRPTIDEMETLFVRRIPDLIRRFKEGGLDPAGVNATLQMVSEGAIVTQQKTVILTPPKPKAGKFELLTTFEVTVPENYDHANRLDTFKAAHESEFCYYNSNITDANFSKTPALVPGKKFLVKVLRVKKRVTSDKCLVQLKRLKAILTGVQGLSLAYEQAKEKLPKGLWALSFDEKDNLPFIDGFLRVPRVDLCSDDLFEFDLVIWEGDWNDNHVILAFCELPNAIPSSETKPLDA